MGRFLADVSPLVTSLIVIVSEPPGVNKASTFDSADRDREGEMCLRYGVLAEAGGGAVLTRYVQPIN